MATINLHARPDTWLNLRFGVPYEAAQNALNHVAYMALDLEETGCRLLALSAATNTFNPVPIGNRTANVMQRLWTGIGGQ